MSEFWPEEVQAVLLGNFAEDAKTERKRAKRHKMGGGGDVGLRGFLVLFCFKMGGTWVYL